jgi:hypothetical protein
MQRHSPRVHFAFRVARRADTCCAHAAQQLRHTLCFCSVSSNTYSALACLPLGRLAYACAPAAAHAVWLLCFNSLRALLEEQACACAYKCVLRSALLLLRVEERARAWAHWHAAADTVCSLCSARRTGMCSRTCSGTQVCLLCFHSKSGHVLVHMQWRTHSVSDRHPLREQTGAHAHAVAHRCFRFASARTAGLRSCSGTQSVFAFFRA